MKAITKTVARSTAVLLALSLTILLLCGLFTACGKEEDGTFSKSLHKPIDKDSANLPAESFNELTAEKSKGLSLQIEGTVTAGAKTVTFRLYNANDGDFLFGYGDLLLQKKTESGWETYRRVDDVPEIGLLTPAGGTASEKVRPEQYGVELRSGETYRITFANAPDAYGEFTVQ